MCNNYSMRTLKSWAGKLCMVVFASVLHVAVPAFAQSTASSGATNSGNGTENFDLSGPTPVNSEWLAFAKGLDAEIAERLSQDKFYSSMGDFDIVAVWLNADGVVTKIDNPEGSVDLPASPAFLTEVRKLLLGTRYGPPPTDLPMPIVLEFMPQPWSTPIIVARPH
jgi:hypothetical protein